MKKTIALGVVFLLVFMSFTSISGIQINENIIIPSDRGDILFVGGSGEGNYSSIQDAIDNASDGDTVFVFDDSSPYTERIIIRTSINLVGENRDTTIIDNVGVSIRIDNVNISGFTINKGCISAPEGLSNITVSDNHIARCIVGISFGEVENCFIISNSFTDCETSMWIDYAENIRISNNVFTVDLYWCDFVDDIQCFEGGNHVITNNTFINYRTEEYRRSIYLEGTDGCVIEGNNFNGYGKAIMTVSADYNIISYNNIIDNNRGIFLGGYNPSRYNKVINNNFINNKQDASSTFFPRGNIWDGNYWDSWIGVKIPIPYFQQFPKIIWYPFNLGFAIDRHPAKQPCNYTTTQEYDLV